MSKTAILNYPKQAAKAQTNSDRVAFFLELNKPRRYSKKELSVELNLSTNAIAEALKTHPKIEVTGDNPLKYFWRDDFIAKNVQPKNLKIATANRVSSTKICKPKPKAEKLKNIIFSDRHFVSPQPKEQANSNPLCPECDGKSHKRGKSKFGNQIYTCASCGFRFSDPANAEPQTSVVPIIQPEPIKVANHDELEKLLSECRYKTFYAVRRFRDGVFSESIAKKIAKNAFPNIACLPKTRSLVQNSRLLATRVRRAALFVGSPSMTEAIALLISYMAFPDGED